jgi:uncharacterized protein YbjT (DUF2867 family)
VERFAHVSGTGADTASPSLYIRKRGEGELAVRAAFADALLIRPAVMFGPDDSFLMTHMRKRDPALRISNLFDLLPFCRSQDFSRWAGGLHKAGLPD